MGEEEEKGRKMETITRNSAHRVSQSERRKMKPRRDLKNGGVINMREYKKIG